MVFLSIGGFWTLLFAAISTCNGQGCGTNLTALEGKIQSPNFPGVYDANRHCEWFIEAPGNTSRHVELKFTKFNISGSMPECTSGDYLEVFLGCEYYKSIGRFCASISPPTIYSPDSCMKLVFHSDDSKSNVGFQATYVLRLRDTAISNVTAGCGIGIRDNVKQGIIFSPLWPQPHPQYVDCVWEVSSRKNMNLKLSFYDFNLRKQSPCGEYFVDVRSGVNGFRHASSLLEKSRECGHKKPFSIQVKSNIMYIHFTSGGSVGSRGFAAGYVAYELDDVPFNSQVLIIFGIIFLVMLLFAGKILLKKLCSSKSCMDINLRKIRMHRSKRVFPESPVPPIVIGNIRVQSAPTLHESASSPFYCEQCAAEENFDVTKSDTLKKTNPSPKSVRFETKTPAKKRMLLRPRGGNEHR